MTDTSPLAITHSRSAFFAGMRGVAPALIGVVPFGAIVGALVAHLDMTLLQSFGLSALLFAGLSELVALELYAHGAPLMVVIATALIVNLRMAIYSVSIAPFIDGPSRMKKALLSYFLTDQGYAISISRFLRDDSLNFRTAYYVGAGSSVWFIWQLSHFAGYTLGTRVPPSWNLDFFVPLTFMAVLIPLLRGRQMATAAVAAGAAMFVTHLLPFHLGLIAAAVVGVAVGCMTGPNEVADE